MSIKRSSKTGGGVVIPLRIPKPVHTRIRDISEKVHLSNADVMRMAIERGLGSIDKMFREHAEKAA
jgi:predicted DNA-binding protein